MRHVAGKDAGLVRPVDSDETPAGPIRHTGDLALVPKAIGPYTGLPKPVNLVPNVKLAPRRRPDGLPTPTMVLKTVAPSRLSVAVIRARSTRRRWV